MERTGALIQGSYGEYIGTCRLEGRAYGFNVVVCDMNGWERWYERRGGWVVEWEEYKVVVCKDGNVERPSSNIRIY